MSHQVVLDQINKKNVKNRYTSFSVVHDVDLNKILPNSIFEMERKIIDEIIQNNDWFINASICGGYMADFIKWTNGYNDINVYIQLKYEYYSDFKDIKGLVFANEKFKYSTYNSIDYLNTWRARRFVPVNPECSLTLIFICVKKEENLVHILEKFDLNICRVGYDIKYQVLLYWNKSIFSRNEISELMYKTDNHIGTWNRVCKYHERLNLEFIKKNKVEEIKSLESLASEAYFSFINNKR